MYPQRTISPHLLLGATALAFVAAGCADPTSAPRSLTMPKASRTVGPLQPIPAGSTTIFLNSSSSVEFCGYRPTLTPSDPGIFSPTCGPSFDLNVPTALPTYDSSWPIAPHLGSVWIGAQADANLYRPPVGSYDFRTTFTIPAGVTSPLLNLASLADNVAIVFLNGHEVGRNSPTQDCPALGSCNWMLPQLLTMYDNTASDFNIGGVNTLDVIVINTPIGFGPPGFNNGASCATGPQATSPLPDKLPIDGGTWSVGDCRSPSGVNFFGTLSFTPPVALFVIGDAEAHAMGNNVNFWGAQWWKNNQMSGTVSNGVAAFKGYATSSDNVCGGTWTSDPGNSSNPPATIPANVAIIVTSKVIKDGANISGDIKEIVIVHQDGSYGPAPGHDGNGPVIGVFCSTR